ncbi:hypothetical protein D3C78_1569510 [compost metagenome]
MVLLVRQTHLLQLRGQALSLPLQLLDADLRLMEALQVLGALLRQLLPLLGHRSMGLFLHPLRQLGNLDG